MIWIATLAAGFLMNDWLAKSDALRQTAQTAAANAETIKTIAADVKANREASQEMQTAIKLLTEISARQDRELERLGEGRK